MVYNIIEVANTHGGDFNYLKALVREFEVFEGDFGIKFQAFSADGIALPDFGFYEVYKKLYFNPDQWQEIITLASRSKDVWIDVFDPYSVEVIQANLGQIRGIKFQASTLNNYHLINLLSQLDWTNKELVVNVSGYKVGEIAQVVERIQHELKASRLILQIGFQKYPSALNDSGFAKIAVLRETFGLPLSFAEHLPPADEASALVPLTAMMMGAQYIEKHVRLSGDLPEYDHFSSMDFHQYQAYITRLNLYEQALHQPFINENESAYLLESLQIPVLNRSKREGSLICFASDLHYKRTHQKGMNIADLRQLQDKGNVLALEKTVNSVFTPQDFRKARIGVIVAARMKSTRLKRKQVAVIDGLSATELCLRNVLKFEGPDCVVLATSTEAEDAELQQHIYSDEVQFFRGHPIDVLQRYVDAVEKYSIDIIVRVTGDMPYVSNDIYQVLMKAHLSTGADYTRAREAAVGTNLEIISANALRRAKEMFPSADLSEYMTYYFANNPGHFVLQEVDLPPDLVRDYRLTLDYAEDLELFRRIEAHLKESVSGEYSLRDVFKYLDANADEAACNSSLALVYKTDEDLIRRINEVTTYAE